MEYNIIAASASQFFLQASDDPARSCTRKRRLSKSIGTPHPCRRHSVIGSSRSSLRFQDFTAIHRATWRSILTHLAQQLKDPDFRVNLKSQPPPQAQPTAKSGRRCVRVRNIAAAAVPGKLEHSNWTFPPPGTAFIYLQSS